MSFYKYIEQKGKEIMNKLYNDANIIINSINSQTDGEVFDKTVIILDRNDFVFNQRDKELIKQLEKHYNCHISLSPHYAWKENGLEPELQTGVELFFLPVESQLLELKSAL